MVIDCPNPKSYFTEKPKNITFVTIWGGKENVPKVTNKANKNTSSSLMIIQIWDPLVLVTLEES